MPRSTVSGDQITPGYDRDATIRSNRSHRSNRSLHSIYPQEARTPSYRQPPPPSYNHAVAHHSSAKRLSRRDSSPSTVISLDSSNRWEEHNPRWSVWTADTTLNSSEAGDGAVHVASLENEHDRLDKAADLSSVPESSAGGHSHISSGLGFMDRVDHDEDDDLSSDVAGPSSYIENPSSRPPSPTTEAALDAALSSTMLALTTANSLLLSTMSSRRELARLRAVEAALDKDLTRKEADIKRQLESNKKTIRWMERACERLEDVIQGRDTSDIENMSPDQMSLLMSGQNAAVNATPGSAFIARHNRGASTAVSDAREVPIPFGQVEAKDQTATIGKSAAKRLERMLQRTSTEVASKEDAVVAAERPSLIKPSRLRQSGSGRALHLSNSLSASPATSVTAPSTTTDLDASIGSIKGLHAAVRPQQSKQSLRSDSEASTSTEIILGMRDQGDLTSATRTLSKIMDRPGSAILERHDEQNESFASTQYLTPPMNTKPLPSTYDDQDSLSSPSSVATPSMLRHRPSLSSVRSPSSLRVENGPRSSVADQISGVAVRDGSRKGALEALRRLNGGSSNNDLGGAANGVSPNSNTPGAGGGWGGTLASWMGIGGGGGTTNEGGEAS